MRKLVECRDCGHEIATSAKVCPSCGSKKPRGFYHRHPVFSWTAGIFVVLYLVGSCSSKSPSNNTVISPENKTTPSSEIIADKKIEESIVNEIPPKPASSWEYSQRVNKMSEDVVKYATLESDNIVNLGFPYNEGRAELIIQKRYTKAGKVKDTDIILRSHGQIICEGFENCYVSAKFDDGSVKKYSFSESADGDSKIVFINNTSEFLDRLKKSNKLKIEILYFQQGKHVFEFKCENLEPNKL